MFSGHTVAGFTSGEDGIQIIECPESHGVSGFLGSAADVRHQEHVGQLPVFRINVRFIIVNVQPSSCQLSGLERRNQSVVVDHDAAARIDDNGPIRQKSDKVGVKQLDGFRRGNRVERQKVAMGHQLFVGLVIDGAFLERRRHLLQVVIMDLHVESTCPLSDDPSDMEIHYNDLKRMPPEIEDGASYHETPEDLMPHCDFLTLHTVASPETIKLLNADLIALLPDGAIVVNASRGVVIDDDSLIAALKSGKLTAAGLDVYNDEPNINPEYRQLSNVFLMPHIGSATKETRDAMGFRALDNLDAIFAGRVPRDRVA